MEARGTSYSPSDMAADIAKHQFDLPLRMRCKRQNIEQLLEKDFSTTRYIVALASAMGTTAEALMAGRYSPENPILEVPPGSHIDSGTHANTEPAPNIKGKGHYPVVSSVQAGDWTELCDNFHPGDAEDWGFSPHDLGRCGYMLRVTGPSMTNTENGARYSFPQGMLLHINPDLEALPGKFVVVRRESEKEATFKRLVMVDGELYLEAINPDWPNRYLKLRPGDVFCGVVVDASFGKLP